MSVRVSARTSGFTLIEMLVVLSMLAVLASVALPMLELEARRKREAELQRALWEIRDAIDAYKAAVDRGRIMIKAGDSGYPPTLQVLVDGVPDALSLGRTHHFLRRIPRDPFQPDVPAAVVWGVRSYASPADRPEPGADVYDVFSTAPGTSLDGRPYRAW
jgi:general secretion pathway protein G